MNFYFFDFSARRGNAAKASNARWATKSDADDTAASATSPNDDPVNTLGVSGINLASQPTVTGEIVTGGGMAAPAS